MRQLRKGVGRMSKETELLKAIYYQQTVTNAMLSGVIAAINHAPKWIAEEALKISTDAEAKAKEHFGKACEIEKGETE